MKKINIEIKDKKTNLINKVQCEFTDNEIKKIEMFYNNSVNLQSLNIFKKAINSKVVFNYKKEEGFSFEAELPREEEICSLLHKLRKFILNNEYASFNCVMGIIGKKIKNNEIHSMLKQQRKIYDGKYFQEQIKIRSEKQIINSDKILNDWLNSFEYHEDQIKRKEIEELHKLIPLEISRGIFFIMLIEKVKAIINIANFLSLFIGEAKTFKYNL